MYPVEKYARDSSEHEKKIMPLSHSLNETNDTTMQKVKEERENLPYGEEKQILFLEKNLETLLDQKESYKQDLEERRNKPQSILQDKESPVDSDQIYSKETVNKGVFSNKVYEGYFEERNPKVKKNVVDFANTEDIGPEYKINPSTNDIIEKKINNSLSAHTKDQIKEIQLLRFYIQRMKNDSKKKNLQRNQYEQKYAKVRAVNKQKAEEEIHAEKISQGQDLLPYDETVSSVNVDSSTFANNTSSENTDGISCDFYEDNNDNREKDIKKEVNLFDYDKDRPEKFKYVPIFHLIPPPNIRYSKLAFQNEEHSNSSPFSIKMPVLAFCLVLLSLFCFWKSKRK